MTEQKDVTDRKYRIVYRYPNWRKMPVWCRETNLYSDDPSWIQEQAEKLAAKGYQMIKVQKRKDGRWATM